MTLFNFFSVLVVLVSVLLVGVILLQEPKESIATYGGGAPSVQRIGINPQSDFLEKATWVLAGSLLLLALFLALLLKRAPPSSVLLSPNLTAWTQEADEQPAPSHPVAPQTGAPEAAAAGDPAAAEGKAGVGPASTSEANKPKPTPQ